MHYSSKIQEVSASVRDVFAFFSNIKNVENLYKTVPPGSMGMVQNIEFSADSIRVKIDGIGPRFEIFITDREEPSNIHYRLFQSALIKQLDVDLRIKSLTDMKSSLQIDMEVDLPLMVKMMYGSKVQLVLDGTVTYLSKIPFSSLV